MGAACSATVDKKYKTLKNYFLYSKCLSFNVVSGYLPVHGSNYPPVVLVGENHDWNESENFTFWKGFFSRTPRYWERCATLYKALCRTVSACEDPESKILFLVEEKPLNNSAAFLLFCFLLSSTLILK